MLSAWSTIFFNLSKYYSNLDKSRVSVGVGGVHYTLFEWVGLVSSVC